MRVVVLTVAALVTTWLPEVHPQQHALFVKRDALRSVRQGSFREYLPPTSTNTQKPRPFEPPNKGDDNDNFIGYPPAGVSPDPPFHFPGDDGGYKPGDNGGYKPGRPGDNGGYKPGYPGYLPPRPFPTKPPTFKPPTGYPGSSTEFPGGLTGQPGGSTGYPGGSTGYPGVSTEYPGGSTLHPGGPTGYPGGSTLHPGGSTGYPGGSTGYPGGSTIHPGGSTGYPGGSTEHPGSPTVHPGGGYPGSSTEYPGGPSEYPGGSTGYPGSSTEYPGFPGSSTGTYPEHSTPGYPGESTEHPPLTEFPSHPGTTHPPPTHPPTYPTHPPTHPPTYPTHPPTYPTHPPTEIPPTHPPTVPPTHPPTHPPIEIVTDHATVPPTHPVIPEIPIHPPGELVQTDAPVHPTETPEENNVEPSDNESMESETNDDLKHPPHIHGIDVECAKDMMTINIEFNRPFNGIIYSKGYYSHPDCRYVKENSEQTKYTFTVSLNSCGTEFINAFDTQGQSYLENVLVLQNEAGIQEVWDTIRAVRCLWEGNLNKALSVALSVGMLTQEIVTFSGDTAMAKLDIQLGKGPFATPANGLVKIGDTMTLVVSVTGDPGFDIQVKDCRAKDSTGENVVALTDDDGCVIKPKLFGAFQKTRNTGNTGASIMAFAFFSAFKFPDVMDLMIECNVELCKTDCEMCTDPNQKLDPGRRRKRQVHNDTIGEPVTMGKTLRVILPEDLSNGEAIINLRQREEVCMSTHGFVVSSALLISLLTSTTLFSGYLWLKNQRLVLQKL